MTDLILHPTASTPVPVIHVEAGRSGKPRKVKAQRDMTRDDLASLCIAKGMRVLTKHTKAELRAMYASGQHIVPAAQVRASAARKAKAKAAKKAA